jgi:hypothetical protein
MAFTDVLKKAFPFISAAASFGGPLGTMAAGLVGNALGMKTAPAGTGDGISNAIASAFADPTQRAALLKAEQDFQVQMQQLGYQHAEEIDQIAEKDRDSARTMQTTVRSKIPGMLAIFVTLGFFGILAAMFRYQPPQSAHDALMLMLGALGGAWTSIVAYYFGSSSGSDRKTELMAQAAPPK